MTPLEYLLSLEQFGIKLGLDNIRTLCDALGNPQRAYRTVVVAGTNGKGSVTAMVDQALRAAGRSSGRYVSPHLVRLEERFTVHGEEVTRPELERAASAVAAAIARLTGSGAPGVPPTFFEATTAMAFDIFRRARVEIAVLEVGLGGRLDATNVAEPAAVAITSIAHDHEQQLGDTLESIAFEKAGVIKPGTPVVIGPLPDQARVLIAGVARELRAPLIPALEGVTMEVSDTRGEMELALRTPVRGYPPVRLALRGQHQVANAVVAVRLLEELERTGMAIGPDAIASGMRDVRWPGRLEWLDAPGGRVLLDSAHNPAGALSLSRYLEGVPPPMPLVFGAARDKNVAGMAGVLGPAVSRIVATQAATSRAMQADEVAERARRGWPAGRISIEPDPIAAVADALRDDGRACVAGSIYLVGEVRGRLVR